VPVDGLAQKGLIGAKWLGLGLGAVHGPSSSYFDNDIHFQKQPPFFLLFFLGPGDWSFACSIDTQNWVS